MSKFIALCVTFLSVTAHASSYECYLTENFRDGSDSIFSKEIFETTVGSQGVIGTVVGQSFDCRVFQSAKAITLDIGGNLVAVNYSKKLISSVALGTASGAAGVFDSKTELVVSDQSGTATCSCTLK